MSTLRTLAVVSLSAVATCFAAGSPAGAQAAPAAEGETGYLPGASVPAIPNENFQPMLTNGVSPSLLGVAQAAAQGAAACEAEAARCGVSMDGEGRVLVEVDAGGRVQGSSGSLDEAARQSLAALYPDAEVSKAGNGLRAWVKPADLEAFCDSARIATPGATVSQHCPPAPAYGSVNNQGVTVTNADDVHAKGINGTGIKVAILDLGYGGVSSTASSEVGSFYSIQSGFDSDAEIHGTACAEILRDVAPGATLYLYRLDGGLDVYSATQDAISKGCQVISVSLAWMGYPGQGSACDAARYAVSQGALWVNAAGNYGDEQYWETAAPSLGSNSWVDFATGVEMMPIYTNGYAIQLGFSFEAPSGSYARYSAVLYEDTGSGPVAVAQGSSSQYFQYLYRNPVQGASYYLGINRTQTGTVGRMRLQTFNNSFGYYTSQGSMSNPAACPEAIAVGAVNQWSYNASASPTSYSSRGGGAFGLELDACAPTACSTRTYGYFHGTSCSCPNMAGLLALQLGHSATASDPFNMLNFTDIGAAGTDGDSGRGLAMANPAAMVNAPTIVSPAAGALADGLVESVWGPATVQVSGGSQPYAFSIVSGMLPPGLSLGSSSGVISGTPATQGSYSFTVRVSDATLETDERTYSIYVLPAGSVIITSPVDGSLPGATKGTGYSPLTWIADGGSEAYDWSLSSGSVPPGMSFSAAGVLSGSPSTGGNYQFTVRVADAADPGVTYEKQYSMVVSTTGSSNPSVSGGGGGGGGGGCAAAPGDSTTPLAMLLGFVVVAGALLQRRRSMVRK